MIIAGVCYTTNNRDGHLFNTERTVKAVNGTDQTRRIAGGQLQIILSNSLFIIRTVTLAEGFKGNASFFKYARDLGNRRGDMYEIGLWEDSIVESGNDIMYAFNVPQESITIPETMDAIRAATGLQTTREEGTAMTNKYLRIGAFKR